MGVFPTFLAIPATPGEPILFWMHKIENYITAALLIDGITVVQDLF
jgi:hypothetical protein